MGKCTKCGRKTGFMMAMCDPCLAESQRRQDRIQGCRRCGSELPSGAKFCSECGESAGLHADPGEPHPFYKPSARPAPQAAAGQKLPSRPSKAVLASAVGLLVAFFLPWFQLFGMSVSGYDLARLGSYGNLAWLIPILAGATIWISLAGRDNRDLGLITGILPLAGLLYGLISLSSQTGLNRALLHVLSIGAYLTIVFSLSIIAVALAEPPPARTPLIAAPKKRSERECPYCAERILATAKVCKHCGRDVAATE